MRKILYSAFALALAGCGAPPGALDATGPRVIRSEHFTHGTLVEVRLDDGTRCVAFKSGYGGGLSCDFRSAE